MTFIGIVSDKKSFDIIKENIISENIKLIHINNKSIENVKNIMFETIIINKELRSLHKKIHLLESICTKTKYLIINTDIKIKLNLADDTKTNIITYGLNQKATVTVSSITESSVLISLQRNMENKYGKAIEVQEKRIITNKEKQIKIYEILIIYVLYIINDLRIMMKV